MRKLRFSLLLGAALALSVPALAQSEEDATRTAARALGNSGVEAYQAGDYVMATDRLEKAYAILRVPSLGLWSARALVQTGKWVEALDRYLEVASLQVPAGDYAVQKQAQADAEADLAALRPRIPIVKVATEGAALTHTEVSIDGKAVPSGLAGEGRLLNPGQHVIEGRHAGVVARVELKLAEGQRETAVLRFEGAVAPAPAPDPLKDQGPKSDGKVQRTAGYVTLGAGVVGLGVGTAFGILALGKESKLDGNPQCEGTRCGPELESEVDSYNTARTVSSVGFIAGGVLAGVGAVLVLSAPKGQKAHAEAWFSPNAAGLRGRF